MQTPNEDPTFDHHLLYGDGHVPRRPRRSRSSPLANRDVRLMGDDDLARSRRRAGSPGTVTWPCTPVVETGDDGARLEARPFAGLPMEAADRRRNTLVCGAIGSGKTKCFGEPNVAAILLDTDESVVWTNVKGPHETEQLRAAARRIDPSIEVIVFAPSDPGRSVACNLLRLARRCGLLPRVASFVAEMIPRGRNDSGFWESVSRKATMAAIRHPEIDSLAALHELFVRPSNLVAFAKATGDSELLEFDGYRDSGANGQTSLVDLIARVAPLCESDAVRAVTSGADGLDLAELFAGGRRFLLVVECNENEFESCRAVLGLFFTLLFSCAVQAAERAGGLLPRPVSIVLDEFGNLPPIPDAGRTFNLFRSRGVSFTCMVQTLDQIHATYGAAAPSILAAFCSKVFFCSGLGLPEREYSSRLAGSIVVDGWQETQHLLPEGVWDPVARASQSVHRPLVMPDDLLLPPHPVFGGAAYCFLVDRPPVIVHFTPSFELPVFQAAAAEVAERGIGVASDPLPPVPAEGHLAGIVGASPPAGPPRGKAGTPDGFTETRGWSDARILARLEEVKAKLDWVNTPDGSARKWWLEFERANGKRPAVVLRLAEELASRSATITECFLAYVYSNADCPKAVLAYLDYTRLKKAHEHRTRKSRQQRSETEEGGP